MTSPAFGLEPGTVAHAVLLSAPMQDGIRTWDEDGPRDWLVDDAALMAGMIGRGQVARTEVEPSRFREAGLLAAEEGVLILPTRFADQGCVESTVLQVRPAESRDAGEAPDWRGFADWLNEVTFDAARRGEIVVVERGGWMHCPHPYALFMCHRPERQWISLLEASPPPQDETPPWTPRSPDPHGHTVMAPADAGTLRIAGWALVAAVSEWAEAPAELAVTFAAAPDGPWPVD